GLDWVGKGAKGSYAAATLLLSPTCQRGMFPRWRVGLRAWGLCNSPCRGPQCGQRIVIVRMAGDFRHVLDVRDFATAVDHENRARQQRQRQSLDQDAVILSE